MDDLERSCRAVDPTLGGAAYACGEPREAASLGRMDAGQSGQDRVRALACSGESARVFGRAL